MMVHVDLAGNRSIVKVKKDHPDAIIPRKNLASDACYDLFACESVTIPAHGRAFVKVGVRLLIPEGYFCQIQGRSGWGIKHNVRPFPGIIDAGYSGDLSIMVDNFGDEPFVFEKGWKVAQFTVEHVLDHMVELTEATPGEWERYCKESERKDNGLGSSNKH